MNELQDQDILSFLLEILDSQEDLLYGVSEDALSGQLGTLRKKIAEINIHKPSQILFLGGFGSGKSALINALLGKKVLKATPLPSASVPTELHYGETQKLIVYPNKDSLKESESTAPYEIKAELNEFIHYCKIDYEAEWMNWQPKFNKILFYCPLPFLNERVLVDTPGLRNQYSDDWILHQCKNTDAIVYVMSSSMPLTATDRSILELIYSSGYSSVIFAITMFDMVPDNAQEKFRRVIRNQCKNYTGLGTDAVHFVSSLDALAAKLDNDKWKLADSGIDALEKQLETLGDSYFSNAPHVNTYSANIGSRASNFIVNPHQEADKQRKLILLVADEMLDISRTIRHNHEGQFTNELEAIDSKIAQIRK